MTWSPEDEELERKKVSLAELEAQPAYRELDLASFLAGLVEFEKCYLQTAGRRCAVLNSLNARIAEVRAQQNRHRQDTRDQASQARSQVQNPARAVAGENPGTPSPDDLASLSKPKRCESPSKLYRQAATLLRRDLTVDGLPSTDVFLLEEA